MPTLSGVLWVAGAGGAEGAHLRYAVTALDRNGRLADRSVLTFLGWTAGQAVEVTVTDEQFVIVRAGVGSRINRRGHLQLPLHVRRTSGLGPGDRVLMAGDRQRRELLVVPTTVLASMIKVTQNAPVEGTGDDRDG
jgi:bifunctional DNA-binding transcriptional regulator/antitoxin component of YhaV-PrlF toxin-antitoxin module